MKVSFSLLKNDNLSFLLFKIIRINNNLKPFLNFFVDFNSQKVQRVKVPENGRNRRVNRKKLSLSITLILLR